MKNWLPAFQLKVQDIRNVLGQKVIAILTKERAEDSEPLADYAGLSATIRPGDVLLVEGRTRVSQIIQMLSHSRWSHSAMCVGKVADFKQHLAEGFDIEKLDPKLIYLVEAELGKGTILTPMNEYADFRLRVCRPSGLSQADQVRVICYVIKRLGTEYDVRQLADLARFMFPYGILPRKWRSSLFEHNAGSETKIVCSTLLADAFQAVNFPVMPIVSADSQGSSRLFKRNPKLFAPSDFDISPYFDVLKFPRYAMEGEKNSKGYLHHLPWAKYEKRYYNRLPWAHNVTPAAPHDEIDPYYNELEKTSNFKSVAQAEAPLENKA